MEIETWPVSITKRKEMAEVLHKYANTRWFKYDQDWGRVSP